MGRTINACTLYRHGILIKTGKVDNDMELCVSATVPYLGTLFCTCRSTKTFNVAVIVVDDDV